jgi:hypothetical protein
MENSHSTTTGYTSRHPVKIAKSLFEMSALGF